MGAVLPAVKDNMEKLKVAHFCLHASMLMCGCRRGSPVCACVRVSLLVRSQRVLWWAPGLRSGEPAGLYERGRGVPRHAGCPICPLDCRVLRACFRLCVHLAYISVASCVSPCSSEDGAARVHPPTRRCPAGAEITTINDTNTRVSALQKVQHAHCIFWSRGHRQAGTVGLAEEHFRLAGAWGRRQGPVNALD